MKKKVYMQPQVCSHELHIENTILQTSPASEPTLMLYDYDDEVEQL